MVDKPENFAELPPVVQLNILTDQLDEATRRLEFTGKDYAEAEHDYKVELAKTTLALRDAKQMPVTMLPLVVYGVDSVADLRRNRDVAEALYKANLEAINTIKLQIRVIHEQMQQDWGQTKYV